MGKFSEISEVGEGDNLINERFIYGSWRYIFKSKMNLPLNAKTCWFSGSCIFFFPLVQFF